MWIGMLVLVGVESSCRGYLCRLGCSEGGLGKGMEERHCLREY